MDDHRKIEIFSAGCPLCDAAAKRVRELACPSCDVTVMDMNEPSVFARARQLGVQSIPAVAVDGRLADCCNRRGIDEEALKDAGLGVPRSTNR